MDARITALKLVLDQLGEDANVATVDDRLRVQKAVYLTQVSAVHLGYSYNWYLKGPYSPSLTKDYYELAESVEDGAAEAQKRLKAEIVSKLDQTKDLLEKPEDIPLPKHHWYELLASLHYLLKYNRFTFAQARERLAELKPHLEGYLDRGFDRLQQHQLT